MWICKSCGAESSNDSKEFCFECMTPREMVYSQREKPMFTNSDNNSNPTGNAFISGVQGYILIALSVIIIGLIAWSVFKPKPIYAYKVINVQAQFDKSSSGDSDIKTTSVNLQDEQLTLLGNEGWELVGTFLESETTHPNYGNSSYVTGLQPNIRPQKAVLLFKKQL